MLVMKEVERTYAYNHILNRILQKNIRDSLFIHFHPRLFLAKMCLKSHKTWRFNRISIYEVGGGEINRKSVLMSYLLQYLFTTELTTNGEI